MRRFFLLVATAAFVVSVAVPMLAAGESKTVTGEVIDMACYAKGSDNVGAGHSACAMKCAKGGGALGILTADGVLAITGDMTNDNNMKLVEYVAKNVKAMGDVTEQDGKMSIDVASIEAQ